MRDQEGPTEFKELRCSMCKYHSQRMERSGRNPIYRHYCKHPDKKEDRHMKDYMNPEEGAWIGKTDYTPSWCPYLTNTKSESNEPTN